MTSHRGHTLIETLVVLACLGLLLTLAGPPLARRRDDAAVRAARDRVAAAIARTRAEAAAGGGATLVLDPERQRLWIRNAAGDAVDGVDLGRRYGIRLDRSGPGLIELRYDGLALGRWTNRTIVLRRGRAEAGLTVSAYGRVRTW